MAKSINQAILMGRLTRDPELRTTTSGKTVVNFSLAVDKLGQDNGADFFEIVAWEKLAGLIGQYLKKGSRCLIQGRLSQRQWEQDGNKRSRIEVIANDVTFLDSASSNSSNSGAQYSAPAPQKAASIADNIEINEADIDVSDIPF